MQGIKLIVGVVALVLIAGGGYAGYVAWEEDKKEQEALAEKARQERLAKEMKMAEEAKLASRTKCADAGKYFVISLDREGAVGQDILVKKKTEDQNISCKYEVGEGDFEIKNSDPESAVGLGADAFVTNVDTDSKTKSFRLYDLAEGKKITEKQYFGELNLSSTTLVYTGLAKEKASSKNCKEFKKFTDEKLTPTLVVDKTIDLKTYLVKDAKSNKCIGV